MYDPVTVQELDTPEYLLGHLLHQMGRDTWPSAGGHVRGQIPFHVFEHQPQGQATIEPLGSAVGGG